MDVALDNTFLVYEEAEAKEYTDASVESVSRGVSLRVVRTIACFYLDGQADHNKRSKCRMISVQDTGWLPCQWEGKLRLQISLLQFVPLRDGTDQTYPTAVGPTSVR